MPDGVCRARYMHVELVLSLCTQGEICSRNKYSCSGVCVSMSMWDPVLLSVCLGGFSVIIDVCADYLTSFYNRIEDTPE